MLVLLSFGEKINQCENTLGAKNVSFPLTNKYQGSTVLIPAPESHFPLKPIK